MYTYTKIGIDYFLLIHGSFCPIKCASAKDMLYFVPQKIVSSQLTDYLLHNNLTSILTDLYNSENGNNYFDFSTTDDGKISYLKGDRIPKEENLLFDATYREGKAYHGKIGRLLSDDFKQNNNEDIQKISALMSNRTLKDTKLFLTDKICHYYHEKNYSDIMGSKGNLGSSCMRMDYLQDAIRLYEKFGSDVVQLLVLTDNNDKVLGRALLWHKVKCDSKLVKYMDRVYACNDNISHILHNYAKENHILSKNDKQDSHLYVNVNIDGDDSVPYMDTFKYFCNVEGLNTSSGEYTLENTEGELLLRNNENLTECGDCGTEYNNEDEGNYSERHEMALCDSCSYWVNDEILMEDDIVNIDGEIYDKEDENIIQLDDGEYFHMDNVCYSEMNGQYYHIEDVVYSEHHQDYLLSEDAINVNDDYYMPDDEEIVQIDGEYQLKEECVQINDKWYLEIDENVKFNDYEEKYELIENDIALKEDVPIKEIEIFDVINRKGEIIQVEGESFEYTKDYYTIKLFVHKRINNDGSYVVSEVKTGSIASIGGFLTKEDAKGSAIKRLDGMSLVEIKNAISRTLEKRQVLTTV